MSFDLSPFLEDFRTEAREHLAAIEQQLLVLERDPSEKECVRALFIAAHTIKGGSAMLGLSSISTLAHALEDMLALLRDGRRSLDSSGASLMFRTIDTLRELVSQTSPNVTGPESSIAQLVEHLRRWTASEPEPSVPTNYRDATPADVTVQALVVEDSATVRFLEAHWLTEAGLRVDAVTTGTEALALAEANGYAVIVTGIELDGLPGPALVSALRAEVRYRDVPIIVVTSYEDTEQRFPSLANDVHALVYKGKRQLEQLGILATRLITSQQQLA